MDFRYVPITLLYRSTYDLHPFRRLINDDLVVNVLFAVALLILVRVFGYDLHFAARIFRTCWAAFVLFYELWRDAGEGGRDRRRLQ